jgi:hypothetical protein
LPGRPGRDRIHRPWVNISIRPVKIFGALMSLRYIEFVPEK